MITAWRVWALFFSLFICAKEFCTGLSRPKFLLLWLRFVKSSAFSGLVLFLSYSRHMYLMGWLLRRRLIFVSEITRLGACYL